jgi:hypothetical protein
MWYIIAIVWLLLALPLARDTDREIASQAPQNRFNIVFNLIVFARTLVAVPIFYVMIIKNLLTRK